MDVCVCVCVCGGGGGGGGDCGQHIESFQMMSSKSSLMSVTLFSKITVNPRL